MTMRHREKYSRSFPAFTSCLLALFLVGAVGCGKDDAADKDADALKDNKRPGDNLVRARNKNLTRDGMGVKTLDLNRDEKPDQWVLTGAGGVVVRIERDLNFDGAVDVWQYPDANGIILEEEMDLDHDRLVDVIAYYREDGSLERKELALEFGNVFTVFKFYDPAGLLLRVEHDEDGDQLVDRWDYYEKNRVVRTGWDENRDGVPDRFDNLP
jgi:hypothetical protein